MNQIRIMELRGTYKGGGGPDKTILLSAAKHDKNNFFVLVTYLRDPDDDDFQIASMAQKYNVPNYVEVFDRSIVDIRCLLTLNKYVKEYQIQIVHTHDLKTTLLGFFLKFLNPKIKIMHTAHGWIVHTRLDSFKHKLQFIILRFYQLNIAVSKATKNIMLKEGISSSSIKVLHNAIDTKTWSKRNVRSVIRKEFCIPEDYFVIGTIGRLSKEKDLISFLRIASKILYNFEKTKFLIVGDGIEKTKKELINYTKQLNIQHSVIFTGHRKDLLNIYAGIDLFLTTSLTEGIPNTILEAMAMEVPVVATRVGGVPELIENTKTGILCNPREISNISNLVKELMTDQTLRKEIACRARKHIIDKFSFNRRCKIIENYYRGLV